MSAHAISVEAPPPKKMPAPLNGINTPALFATIDVVKNQPQLGAFQFRAKGDWLGGTHMQTTMSDFSGAGGEHSHKAAYTAEADHPAVLCGAGQRRRRRSNTCCTRSPPASRPASPTSPRHVASPCIP